jgi:steroid delta-isomerase-like uncharacterized protein
MGDAGSGRCVPPVLSRPEKERPVSEENKALASRGWEAVSRGDLDALDEVYAPDLVWHEPDEDIRGIEAAKRFVAMYLSAFPDISITVEDAIAEGDKVVTRWTARGTHRGELLGIAPTEERITVTGITVHRVQDGRIVEEWESPDNLGLLQQVGAIPEQAQAGS